MNLRLPAAQTRQLALHECGLILCCALVLVSACDRSKTHAPKTDSASGQFLTQTSLVPLTNMVLIKAGSFTRMRQRITLTSDFWIGRFEVTQGEYSSAMGKNPSHFQGDTNCPVEKISYFGALEYCAHVSQRERDAGRLPLAYEYRLPTEAEWEYACRAGSTNFYSFGDDAGVADRYAWTLDNSEAKTHPVGQKLPNAWGLYDMHGNVWEWCQDWFTNFPHQDLQDPRGPAEGKFKVFRGGSWTHPVELARAANRFMMSPSNGIYFVGFRLALSQHQEASH